MNIQYLMYTSSLFEKYQFEEFLQSWKKIFYVENIIKYLWKYF